MLDPILHLDISPSQDDNYIVMQVREEEFVWLRSEDLSFQLEFDGFMWICWNSLLDVGAGVENDRDRENLLEGNLS